MPDKIVTEKELIIALDNYLFQLGENPKVSRTAFHHMQVAIVGCKFLINDAFGTKRKSQIALIK